VKTFWFIINPKSGPKASQILERVKRAVLDEVQRHAACQAIIKTTAYAGHATELAREGAQAGAEVVVAVGGDGTVNEVACGLLYTTAILGIVPVGSGNGLARHLGISMNIKRSVEQLFTNHARLIDSATINGQPFFCTAGVGFDAYVAAQFAQEATRGLRTYVRSTFKSFWEYQPQPYDLNGQKQQLFTLTFANASQFGNNAYIAPQADISDGLLDVCLMRPFAKIRGVELSTRLFTKSLPACNFIDYQRLATGTVESEQPFLIHYDGESLQLDATVLKIAVVPQSLRVIAVS
jgi:diacylglycerol kinase (ATP)